MRRLFMPLLAATIAASSVAIAANTTLFSSKSGDVVFPISPPNRTGTVPGAIDNMAIGTTTPAAGSFTTLKSTDGLVCPTFYTIGAPAAATDSVFFVATRAYTLISASQVHAVAAGGASTLQVVKDTGTNAPGAGVDLLSAAFDLNATANTVQVGALTATAADKAIAAGDRLAVDFANAIQSSSGVAVTACLAPR